jgi:ribonuclease Z
MKQSFVAISLAAVFLVTSASISDAAPCLIVTLTGTQGGPQSFNGLAGAGTLVRYGDDANGCASIIVGTDLATSRLPAK